MTDPRHADAVLVDFFGTLAVAGPIERWADAAGSSAMPSTIARTVTARLPTVWVDAATRHPAGDWDLDPALHRTAFTDTLTRGDRRLAPAAVALYDTMLDQCVPNRGAIAFLHDLHARGVPLALVSNTALDVRPVLHRWGVAEAFTAVVLSFEVGRVKPDPVIFRLAADAVGTSPDRCLMIGDSRRDDGDAADVGVRTHIAPPDEMWRMFDEVRHGA
ncbi:HAD family hydrolase [Microbacterium gorillae]|uniref:HAD family hydrolase n=1 Tax=Microbacterium gorillae TaxID=1231063 RepID=UPI000693B2E0|nr:HAD family hydrolase [Microbacterium gorillae]